jgi:cell division protein FtsW (lipid II flippase)
LLNLLVQLSKYINILLIAFYTFYTFYVLGNNDKKKQNRIYGKMTGIIYAFHFISYLILYINSMNIKIVFLYVGQLIGITLVFILYQWIYSNISILVLHNMIFLLTIGMVMLTRLAYQKAVKQSIIVGVTLVICLIIPLLIDKLKHLSKFGWFYGGLGVVLLLSVLFLGIEQYGATNWISIFGFTIQPSEFVKLIFVFSIASLLSKRKDFRYVAVVTILAAIHVLILVAGKDLGGALIFFVTYLVMLYIATCNPFYFLAGLSGGVLASVVAYQLFYHVKVRVMAWSNPWAYIDKEGYQISQSLFAIGTGGWFGMGLSKGLPTSIPVVDSDFIFSAISEEMGAIFALCLILICISCFIMFVTIAMKLDNEFYKLIAIGLSILYIFQVFLSIGGVTKFIPSTGVTLPLISYGGSSILSSLLMFSVIQGLYVFSQDGNDNIEKRKRKRNRKKKTKNSEKEGKSAAAR